MKLHLNQPIIQRSIRDKSAEIYLRNEYIGCIGVVHPELERKLDLNGRTVVFEIRWDAIANRNLPQAKSCFTFPFES